MEGAQGVLMSIAGGSDLGLFEINEAASLVQDAAHQDANIIFGTVIDDSLGDEVRVTVIAAGFDASSPSRNPVIGAAAGAGAAAAPAAAGATAAPASASGIAPGAAGKLSSSLFEPIESIQPREPVSVPAHTNGSSRFGDDDDDVDVPPFMRH